LHTVEPLSVCVLDGVRASRGDQRIPIIGPKLQGILGALALAVPHSVSTDRLIDGIWGEATLGNPLNALQAQISQLRRAVGNDAVRHGDGGYRLAVEPDDVDALVMARCLDEGRAAASRGDLAEASERFTAATALAHGTPLAGVLDLPFAGAESTRLTELLLSAHEGDIDARLGLGRHAEVLAPIQALVAQHPWHERFHAQLIIALYRCGRQADALAAFQRVRKGLADELGLDVGPELQALERAVLSQDPALASPVPLAASRRATVLPTYLTSFVGRAAEFAQLAEAVTRNRIVTVVGPGGVGKSRLLVESVAGWATEREVWYIELAPVLDPVAVPETIAAAVGAPDASTTDDPAAGRPLLRIIDRIGKRDATIVLDNCEHVAEAAGRTAFALLNACPELRIVCTSREPLAVAGELLVHLTPLAAGDAAGLFLERARSVQPDVRIDPEDEELRDLCAQLDNLPLAIELAAAKTKLLAVGEITARLQDRFRLLRSSDRIGEERHRGLRATIDGSYEMLFEGERRTFCRLALFAGGATVEAIESVCGEDALEDVERLIERSLVTADRSGPRTRFRMLESLRAYGVARLVDDGGDSDAIADFLAWHTDLAHRAEIAARGADQVEWLERLDEEHDNLRAAFAHAESHDPDAGLRLIGSLILPWYYRGRRQESRHWAETFLDASVQPDPATLAKALAWCGFIAESSGWTGTPGGIEQELDLAERRQRRALELALGTGDRQLIADVRMLLPVTLTRRAVAGIDTRPQELDDLLGSARLAYAELDDDYGASIVALTHAIVALSSGDLEAATALVETARRHAVRTGERFTNSRVEWLLGMLADVRGDPETAYHHIERSIRLMDELGMEQAVTAQAALLVPLAERSGWPELAAQWRTYVQGRVPGVARDELLTMASARNGEALAARARGDVDHARAAHLDALTSYETAGVSGGVAYTETCLGFLEEAMGDGDAAADHHAAALAAAMTANEPASLALALEGLASVARAADIDASAELLGAASAIWSEAPGATASCRSDVQRVTDDVRARLGATAFDAAFERGSCLDRHDATTAALRSVPRQLRS
jgi:predicted ATPase/DNA-binding SARP family transcriptional activator